MNLKKMINKTVIKSKPTEVYEDFYDFSFMDSPIQIIDVGQNFIFYKDISHFTYIPESVIKKDEIRKIPIVYNDNSWVIYDPDQKEDYVTNRINRHIKYEKENPELIRAMRSAY